MGTLTETEKVDIRRHCGYPMHGASPVQAFGHRFYQHYGTLEFRMNNLSAEEETVVRAHLTKINQLETDIYGVRENVDTSSAAVWTRNADEHGDRERLYDAWCKRLLALFGVPPGPSKAHGNTLQLVV